MATEQQVYPLGVPPGNVVPFDLGDPIGLFITSIADTASALRTMDDEWELVVLYATAQCIIAFGADPTLTIAENAVKEDHQIIPEYFPIAIKLPDHRFKVIGTEAGVTGKLYVQAYRRWQALTTEALATRL